MQSEFACHVGSMGKFFCRVCHVKGSDAQDTTPVVALQLPKGLDARNSETSLDTVENSARSLESEVSSVESSVVSSIESSAVSSVEPDERDQESGLSSSEEGGDGDGEDGNGDEGGEDGEGGEGDEDGEGGDSGLGDGEHNIDQGSQTTAPPPSPKNPNGRKKKLETMEEMVDRVERFLKASVGLIHTYTG